MSWLGAVLLLLPSYIVSGIAMSYNLGRVRKSFDIIMLVNYHLENKLILTLTFSDSTF